MSAKNSSIETYSITEVIEVKGEKLPIRKIQQLGKIATELCVEL